MNEEPLFRCTVCGREGSVGRCCGDETREPLNEAARKTKQFDMEIAYREKLNEHALYRPSTLHMNEIAKCPLCWEDPRQLGKDSYSKYGISCCGHTIWAKDNPTSWNRYAAAMELAEALAWKDDVEYFISYARCRLQRKSFPVILKIANNAEDMVYDAEVSVREAFKDEG